MVGTVVHEWMQKIAEEGLSEWTRSRLDNEQESIKRQLTSLGIPHSSVDLFLVKVSKCLTTSIDSETGRWLLTDYPDKANELTLHGIIDHQIIHAVVDRTFIDASGVRWVVDYKTSQCPVGMSIDSFLQDETKKYRPQLETYATLLNALDPETEIRCGLYFPMIDSWIEVTV